MAMAVPAFAQDWNKASLVTFDSWVEIPGGVLPGGRYIFKLSDSNSNRHIVRIYDQVSGILVATLATVPEIRTGFTDNESIRFEEGTSPNPQAVKAWFHQGSPDGEQFVYLNREPLRFVVPEVQATASLGEAPDQR